MIKWILCIASIVVGLYVSDMVLAKRDYDQANKLCSSLKIGMPQSKVIEITSEAESRHSIVESVAIVGSSACRCVINYNKMKIITKVGQALCVD